MVDKQYERKEVNILSENLTRRILRQHLISGNMVAGEEISIHIDQTLTQDATGTMAYLQFESMRIDQVKTELSVSYVDHSCLQVGFRNADDHRYLQTVAARHGIVFSRPGNGICHQLHMERFGVPGKTLLGSDSHTSTGGALGMLAIGAGGLDIALAMGGLPFHVKMPKIVNIRLHGQLKPYVTSKDIILELLRRYSVKGGVGKVFEFSGPGVGTLTVPQRATICNMGAELGLTTSIFPADEQTYRFLKAQGREKCYKEEKTGEGYDYDEIVDINLSTLEPMVAQPHMPDRVVPVTELKGMKVDQVWIGSCTNGNYHDFVQVAKILKGNHVAPNVSLSMSVASRQVLRMLTEEGWLADIIDAGARLLELTCGPCGGAGQSPCSGGISIRTNNRNFEGRSGTKDAKVYLVSPETAAMTAIRGTLTTAEEFSTRLENYQEPEQYYIDDSMFLAPAPAGNKVQVIKGPNIKGLPPFDELKDKINGEVILKVGDNISTDHIIPALPDIVMFRSNIPAISEYVFSGVDPEFASRCKEKKGGFVVAGKNYGQGSSREHAALGPKYLGIKAVIAISFARIHSQNLANFGVLPLEFKNESDYGRIDQGDRLELDGMLQALDHNGIIMKNLSKNESYVLVHHLSDYQIRSIKAGSVLKLNTNRK